MIFICFIQKYFIHLYLFVFVNFHQIKKIDFDVYNIKFFIFFINLMIYLFVFIDTEIEVFK